MHATIEKVSNLERRLHVALPMQEIEAEVESRLKRLARSVKMHGFRPGKVPLRLVQAQFGGQVRQEVLGDALQKSFGEAVRQQNLRVAGYPRFEPRAPAPAGDAAAAAGGDAAAGEGAQSANAGGSAAPGGEAPAAEQPPQVEFSATFEVYPEVTIGDVSATIVVRPAVAVGDAEVAKTVDILRKQRVHYHAVERGAQAGDRITVDYQGSIDGAPFEGGNGNDHTTILGEGRLLAEFEKQVEGAKPGERRKFELTFPEDYHGKEVAGKTAQFEVTVKHVAAPHLPEVNADFAKSLGIADGDLTKMHADVKANLEREVRRRRDARVKDQVMKTLLETASIELPRSLVRMEIERLMQGMRQDLAGRGLKPENIPMPAEAFEPEARKRVALGLIVAELVRRENLAARPEQVKAMVQDYAESYEKPEEVVRWYYQSQDRLREVESLVLENNVVEWVLGRAIVEDRPTDFDDLMDNKVTTGAAP
jgi:trigger factor